MQASINNMLDAMSRKINGISCTQFRKVKYDFISLFV